MSRDAPRRSTSARRARWRCAASGTRPRQLRRVDHDRGGRRPHLGGERQRIGLERQQLAVAADDLVFVFVAGARAGNEDFPVAVAAHAHGVAAAVPEIEIADHADAPRVRREHHEGDAVDAVDAASDARRACRRARDACLRRADGGRDRTGSAESGRRPPARPRGRRSARAGGSAGRAQSTGPANRPASWMRGSSLIVAGVVEHLDRRARRAGTRAPPARRPRSAGRDS